MTQIFAFGDSITWGAWDVNGGWADLLKKETVQYLDGLDEEREIIFYNLGIPGDTTDRLMKRLRFEVDQRLRSDDHDRYFLFAFGANDVAFLSVDEYETNTRKAIELVQDYSDKVVFINTTPVDESKTDGVLVENISRTNDAIDKYNGVLSKVCKETGADLIDVSSEFKRNDYTTLLYEDGLHPNSEGHEVILKVVKEYLINKLGIA